MEDVLEESEARLEAGMLFKDIPISQVRNDEHQDKVVAGETEEEGNELKNILEIESTGLTD